jgi:hypothetical protein
MKWLQWHARKCAGVLTVPLMLAGMLAALNPAAASASPAVAGSGWTAVEPHSPGGYGNDLSGVAVLSASSVWAVGSYTKNADGLSVDLIEHWNGSAWSVVSSPDPGGGAGDFLSGVSAVSPSDIWAVGTYFTSTAVRTLVLHWNGTAWSHVASPNPGSYDNDLTAVDAISADDIWAVGDYNNGSAGPDQTLILHWNGASWTQVPSPDPDAQNDLSAVSATSSSNAWAVGEFGPLFSSSTFILHWNGTAWTQVSLPALPDGAELFGVDATAAGNAWAVGSTATKTVMLHWNGTAWALTPSPKLISSSPSGVVATSATNAWAIAGTQILHWNGTKWSQVTISRPKNVTLDGIAATSPTTAWAVGQHGNGVNADALALECCTAARTR